MLSLPVLAAVTMVLEKGFPSLTRVYPNLSPDPHPGLSPFSLLSLPPTSIERPGWMILAASILRCTTDPRATLVNSLAR